MISPGLIDAHVHINEPGRMDWEGFETATHAAAAGGVTLLMDMPLNSSPVSTTVDALRQKREASAGKLYVDCGLYAGLVPGNLSELDAMQAAGVFGYKAFLIDSGLDEFLPVGEQELKAAMPLIANLHEMLLLHAELPQSPITFPPQSRRYCDYMMSRPPEMELAAIRLLIGLSRQYGCRVHIVHLATAAALPKLRAAKAEGLPITVETAPHYLFFADEDIPDGATEFKCAPPIRDAANREGLWDGLREGVIDTIGSDHSPCPPAMKYRESGDFSKAWGGIASLQWLLPIVWTGARKRGFTPDDMARWLTFGPSRLFGWEHHCGRIAEMGMANFVIWDPDADFTVRPEGTHHRHKTTPYNGVELFGVVQTTYLHGQKIFDGGKFCSPPIGELVVANEF